MATQTGKLAWGPSLCSFLEVCFEFIVHLNKKTLQRMLGRQKDTKTPTSSLFAMIVCYHTLVLLFFCEL